jgi:flagellar hook-length control protein FliK
VSSVASHVHATSIFASSRQPQIAGSTADTDSDPFTAMFDAMASGQDPAVAPTTTTQPDTKPAATPTNESPAGTSAATGAKTADQTANQSAGTTSPASGAPDPTTSTDDQIFTATAGGNLIQATTAMKVGDTSEKSSPAGGKGKTGAGSIADKLSGILAAAGQGAANNGDATTNAAGQTQVSASSTTKPEDSTNAANTAAPGATDVAGIIAAVKAALAGSKPQTTASSDSSGKPSGSASSQDSSDDSSDSAQSSGADANAAASTQIQQAAVQPIAAAIPVNSQINASQTSGNTSTDVQVGDATKSRTKLALALADGKNNAPAPASNDTEAARPTPATGNPELKAGKQSNANNSSNAQTADSTDAQQSQSANDTAAPAQLSGNVPSTTGDQPTPRAGTFAAALTSDGSGSAGSQTASTSAKVDATGLPSFGITATNASAPSTGTTASATANGSNTVPVAGLAVAITSRAQAGSSQFDIRLDPPELGRIEVRLGVDSDGRVTSHVTVDRADTLQLLQDQQPQLQQALDQAGLKTADNGLQFTLRDQSFAGQQNNGGNGTQQNTPQLVIPDADLPTVQSAQIYNRLGLGTGVDISV